MKGQQVMKGYLFLLEKCRELSKTCSSALSHLSVSNFSVDISFEEASIPIKLKKL